MATVKIAPTDIKAGTLAATVLANTAPLNDNDTSIATTAFVQQAFTANTVTFTNKFTNTGTVSAPIIDLTIDPATKQNLLTLTTTGTSGAATLVGSTLNIPQYTGGGGGSQTPWASNIDGASFNLSAVKQLNVTVPGTGGTQNLFLFSEQIDNASWVKNSATVVANLALDTLGNNTLDEITITNVAQSVRNNAVITVTPNTQYNFSFDVKRGTSTDLFYSVFNTTGASDIIAPTSYYSLTNGATSVRVSFNFTTPAGCTGVYCYFTRDTPSTGSFFAGRAQLKITSFPYTYSTTLGTPDLGTGGPAIEAINTTATGNTGFGTLTPSEKVDIVGNLQFSGLLKPAGNAGTLGQKLISQGTLQPPTWNDATAWNMTEVNTTNNTVTTVALKGLQIGEIGFIEVNLTGIDANGTAWIVGKKIARYYSADGIIATRGTVINVLPTEKVGLATATWELIANGTDNQIRIQYNGEPALNINWKFDWKYLKNPAPL